MGVPGWGPAPAELRHWRWHQKGPAASLSGDILFQAEGAAHAKALRWGQL